MSTSSLGRDIRRDPLTWGAVVVSMMLAAALVGGLGLAIWDAVSSDETPQVVDGAVKLAGFTGLASFFLGPLYVTRRREIVGPAFPFLRRGYVLLAAPGLPFMALFLATLPWGMPAYPVGYLGIPATFYEIVLPVGALIFVALGRPLGLFEADE
jgi:hypothetical protein